MFFAPIPIALSLFAIFNPPAGLGQTALVFWLALASAALVLIATGDAAILFSRTATEP